MLTKLAANYDEQNSGAPLPTSLTLHGVWQYEISAVGTNYFLIPNFDVGDVLLVVSPYGSGYSYVVPQAAMYSGSNLVGYHAGVNNSRTYDSVTFFYGADSSGSSHRNPSTGNLELRLNIFTYDAPVTNFNNVIKNTNTVTVFHVKFDNPYVHGTHTLTTANSNDTAAPASRNFSTALFNYPAVTTPLGFTFGLVTGHGFVDQATSTTSSWVPGGSSPLSINFQTYYPYYTLPTPVSTSNITETGGSNVLTGSSTNPQALTNAVCWTYPYQFSWQYPAYYYKAWTINSVVVATQPGAPMSVGYRWSWYNASNTTANTTFRVDYIQFNIS